MSRGFFMQLRKQMSTDSEITFSVFASGWDIGTGEIVEVGRLVVDVRAETATFAPSGPWEQDRIVEPFQAIALQPSDAQRLWMRWLLELGARGLVQSEHLTKFV